MAEDFDRIIIIQMETYNISIKRGETWKGLTLQFLINDVLVDLTSATILMQFKKKSCDEQSVVEFSLDNGINITGLGLFEIEAHVFDITPRDYTYDLMVQVNGISYYLIGGTLTVESNVSRL